MSDKPLSDCPVCQGEIRRVVNSVGVVFKGKGFYVTDNRSGSSALLPGAANAKEEKTDSGSSESKEHKESKPAADKPSKESKVEKPASTPAT